MNTITEATLETVSIQQCHEELKVLFLAVVRSGCHQEEMAGDGREELSELIALCVLDLATKEAGGHLVCFITYHKVPPTIRGLQLLLNIFVARQFVESSYGKRSLDEPVTGPCGFELVVGQYLEGQVEAPIQLVLPLLSQAAGTNNQATLEVAPCNELLDEEPCHDCLTSTRVISE